jgi:YHS domain-containing protein
MRNISTIRPLAVLLLAPVLHSAVAGDFFERNGAALGGYDPVSYFTDKMPRKGSAAHQVVYRGSTFFFVNEKDKGIFNQNPGKYAPQFGGFCAYGAAQGYKVTTQPDAYVIVNDKLYLNYDLKVLSRFKEDVSGNIAKAEKNWPEVSKSELHE